MEELLPPCPRPVAAVHSRSQVSLSPESRAAAAQAELSFLLPGPREVGRREGKACIHRSVT